MPDFETCPDCRARLEVGAGDTRHAYFGASGSCWRIYGQILAREYGNPDFMKVHRWTVDAYAAQHPGAPEPRTISSVNLHLLALHLLIEKNRDPAFVTKAMARIREKRPPLQWLPPPHRLGALTVADVVAEQTPETHGRRVREWAADVWRAWEKHHPAVRALASQI